MEPSASVARTLLTEESQEEAMSTGKRSCESRTGEYSQRNAWVCLSNVGLFGCKVLGSWWRKALEAAMRGEHLGGMGVGGRRTGQELEGREAGAYSDEVLLGVSQDTGMEVLSMPVNVLGMRSWGVVSRCSMKET